MCLAPTKISKGPYKLASSRDPQLDYLIMGHSITAHDYGPRVSHDSIPPLNMTMVFTYPMTVYPLNMTMLLMYPMTVYRHWNRLWSSCITYQHNPLNMTMVLMYPMTVYHHWTWLWPSCIPRRYTTTEHDCGPHVSHDSIAPLNMTMVPMYPTTV